jgi:hypothetical protein
MFGFFFGTIISPHLSPVGFFDFLKKKKKKKLRTFEEEAGYFCPQKGFLNRPIFAQWTKSYVVTHASTTRPKVHKIRQMSILRSSQYISPNQQYLTLQNDLKQCLTPITHDHKYRRRRPSSSYGRAMLENME